MVVIYGVPVVIHIISNILILFAVLIIDLNRRQIVMYRWGESSIRRLGVNCNRESCKGQCQAEEDLVHRGGGKKKQDMYGIGVLDTVIGIAQFIHDYKSELAERRTSSASNHPPLYIQLVIIEVTQLPPGPPSIRPLLEMACTSKRQQI